MKFKQQIGESLMRNNRQLKCVYVKSDRLENQFRTPELDFVTGEKMTLVRHKENGAQFEFHLDKTFFCTRLQFERQRLIKRYFKEGQIVVDVFAGIGPLSILGVLKKNVKCFSNDLNSEAIEFFKKNLKLNKIN